MWLECHNSHLQRPFRVENKEGESPAKLRLSIKPSWPPSVRKMLHACWSYSADDRPDATAMIEMLATVRSDVKHAGLLDAELRQAARGSVDLADKTSKVRARLLHALPCAPLCLCTCD